MLAAASFSRGPALDIATGNPACDPPRGIAPCDASLHATKITWSLLQPSCTNRHSFATRNLRIILFASRSVSFVATAEA